MKAISATKKNCSTSASDHYLHSKRIKISSNSSKTNITDLPDFLLVEILCRLPCKKFVFQCKLVSNRWCTLLSDLYFIGRFLCLQSETPIKRTMINSEGEEIPTFSKPLTRLFKRLMSFHSLEKEPVVVGTYNDLVLCSKTEDYQRDYYICNPYTKQWFALPPTPRVHRFAPHAGFIVHELNGQDSTSTTCSIIPNADYSWRVIRILPNPSDLEDFHVEIFSSETREWIELVVLCHGPKNSYNSFHTYDYMSHMTASLLIVEDLSLIMECCVGCVKMTLLLCWIPSPPVVIILLNVGSSRSLTI